MEYDSRQPVPLIARRYMAAFRLFYGGLIALLLPVLISIIFTMNEFGIVVVLLMLLAIGGVVTCAAVYLNDFICPDCRGSSSYRKDGKSFPVTRCRRCGLSLKDAADKA